MTLHRHLPGARLAEAVVCNGIAWLAGQVPENLDADAQAQTANVLAQIDTVLRDLGSDKSQVIDATIFLADLADYDAMNAACMSASCSVAKSAWGEPKARKAVPKAWLEQQMRPTPRTLGK